MAGTDVTTASEAGVATAQPLEDTSHPVMATGHELGYRVATLQSSDMGYRIYLRLGFVEVFRYELHVHLPGGARFGDAGSVQP